MAQTITVQCDCGAVEATRQEVVSSHEPWAEYLCADGTVVRVKLVLTDVYISEHCRQDGKPIIHVVGRTVVAHG